MLVFLVLCAILRTIQGAPRLPPHAYSSGATIDVLTREVSGAPDLEGLQCRTVYSILQSCLVTISACIWTSAHPNINGPRDSGWACWKRRVVTMLCALIAPEMVFFWALRQRAAATVIAKQYNREFVATEETKVSLWRKIEDWFLSQLSDVADWFRPLPKETTWRGDGQLWTSTHGFFIQMGGFILYDNGYPEEVLDYDRLADLLRKKLIDAPTVTERELQDRSKGDAISKAIVVLQTAWFVFQCIARWGRHLPLSELEVLTVAFAVVNLAIYVAWWHKPQGADTAIWVPLKKAAKVVADSATPTTGDELYELQNPRKADDRHSNNSLHLMPPPEQQRDEGIGKKYSWLRCMLRKDREQHSSSYFFLLCVPYRIVFSVIRLLRKSATNELMRRSLRVPMFYASDEMSDTNLFASCSIGTIFGAIHLVAWASQFPSALDRIFWRVSAIVLTATACLPYLAQALDTLGMKVIAKKVDYLVYLLVPFYIVGRLLLIVVALLAISQPPPGVLRDIAWTSYIPHF